MCIAILNKKNSILSKETLINSFENNPNGAGFSYCINNELIIEKGIFNLDIFLERYKAIKEIATSDVLIHCRISTSGQINTTNCHPFKLPNANISMVHNGVCCVLNFPKDYKNSDTHYFTNIFLNSITSLNDIKKFKKLISDYIGTSNKFIFIDDTGETLIINKEQGITDTNGNWFSNSSYQYNITSIYATCNLTRKQIKKVRKNIKNLTTKDLIRMSDFPLINTKTLQLVEYATMTNANDVIPLDEFDYDLYCEYLDKLYDYDTKEMYY